MLKRSFHWLRCHRQVSALLTALCVLLWGSIASAHAFGARHELSVPLYYYVLGAGLTVGLSFVVAAFFLRPHVGPKAAVALCLFREGEPLANVAHLGAIALQVASVAIFALIIVTGYCGDTRPTHNFAPLFVWSLWWVGMVYVQALVGDVWHIVNPWRIVFNLASRVLPQWRVMRRRNYPAWASRWPAFVTFWCFIWLEQVAPVAENPAALVSIIIIYSMITWMGMTVFGRDVWLDKAEVFSILFSYLARMAPTTTLAPEQSEQRRTRGLWLRPFGVGLQVTTPLDRASTSLILLLLASVTFDGFRDTSAWARFIEWTLAQRYLIKPLLTLQQQGVDLRTFLETLGLLVVPLLFFFSYGLISALVAQFTSGRYSARTVAGTFVLTLMPISIAYHIAHYLSFLLLAGQLAIPVLSDPLALGWNLFGARDRLLNVGVIGASTTWWVAILAVVIGHVYAVYLAHVTAIRSMSSRRQALFSQLPLIILMIGYTMTSLWILAQPITNANST